MKCSMSIKGGKKPQVNTVGDLEPLQLAEVISENNAYFGDVVMRSPNTSNFDVFILPFSEDRMWDEPNNIKVRLLESDEIVKLKMSN